jgi:formylglycine-generating enzyme required for sulfatase activity
MTLSPHLRRLGLAAVGALAAAATGVSAQEAPIKPSEMKAYTEALPATDIKFEMVPIPGGTFTIGSPDDEEDRSEDEGPQRKIEIKPFWMGAHEVTWDEYDQFAFSFDLKDKKRRNVELDKQSEGEKAADAITRPTPPYADETFGPGRPARDLRHPPLGHGILPLALGQDGQDLPPAD